MFKENKKKMIISSIVIVLPILLGVIFWNKLPDIMATHWGADGEANGFSSKAFTVFGIPLILLALHLICLFVTSLDNKQINQSLKALGLIFWLVPAVSVFANGVIYSYAFGKEINVSLLSPLFLGLMFIVVGNYMPKTKINRTLGIKIKWTLENEENWNKTHRFAGKVWVFGGIIILLMAFMPEALLVPSVTVLLLVMVMAPIVYSYVFYKKANAKD